MDGHNFNDYMKKAIFLFCLISLMALWDCDDIVLPEAQGCDTLVATYSTNVKPIIDQTCAYSGCHNGTGGVPGNYTTYAGMQSFIADGSFVNRVIDQRSNPSRGMPPNATAYPESQQDDLSPEQLEIIQCWIDGGFEE